MPAKRIALKRAAEPIQPEKESAAPSAALIPSTSAPEPETPPKVIMSKAQRRKLKKPPVVVTTEMKEKAREEKREQRKYLRMIKSNGARRKVAIFNAKRARETNANEEAVSAFDSDYRPLKKGRRME
ncbi:hypothetical protein ABB37_02246 [Leptomonas pyrrhocoris]|uniref:Uncharacterized protein n=1 Tax=Leptomonas pyrrhocoris TaxID=157538 RepID=A0A0M9G7K8_LEPPY|nr:hypothetical protein ABB37_02246 [Leptomonas pyrrhocoris]KPA84183.1 hypothetical protein ABB37_02246 [Leptomonas pyrrhocoris]|eukprot:XP_015662622.1 hypothetical protein ABB37_02246 [Leptomonas pyrrhocoris]